MYFVGFALDRGILVLVFVSRQHMRKRLVHQPLNEFECCLDVDYDDNTKILDYLMSID